MEDTQCSCCSNKFDDIKSAVQCTKCLNYFHAKCENIDLRGFHLRRSTWICGLCTEQEETGPGSRSKKKRTRPDTDDDMIRDLLQMVLDLTKDTKEIKCKLNIVLEENRNLKEQISFLLKNQNVINDQNKNKSYSDVAKNKVLIIKPKEKIDNLNEAKLNLKSKINPADVGVGLSIDGATRDGGFVLRFGGPKDVGVVQKRIQSGLGQEYEVIESTPIIRNKMKIVGVYGDEYSQSDESLIEKLVRQNDLESDKSEIKLTYKGRLINNRFNLSIEVNRYVYEVLKKKERVFVGWSRCVCYDDLSVVRCFNCWGYNHFARACKNKDKTYCPKCSENHRQQECESETKKCINCKTANEKFKLNLDTNHDVWDRECASFKRIVDQRRRYLDCQQV